MTNWDSAVVVDPKLLQGLKDDNAKLRTASRRQRVAIAVFMGSCAISTFALYRESATLTQISREARHCQKVARSSNAAAGVSPVSMDVKSLDVGTQRSLLMSREMYKEWFQPRHARVIAAARLANSLANRGGEFSPVPTAVPPCASG